MSLYKCMLLVFILGLIGVCESQRAANPIEANSPTIKGISSKGSTGGIEEYLLDNGLRILLFPDISKTTFTVNVTYLAGSRQEIYGETGLAHLVEHMMFKGTGSINSITSELIKRGASFNGATTFDYTNYYETMKSSDENLAWSISMEADRMTNSRFDPEDLKSEIKVVSSELDVDENNPTNLLFGQMHAIAYQRHSYNHLSIGNRSDIENSSIETLKTFYGKFYQPENAVITISGNFNKAYLLNQISLKFGKLYGKSYTSTHIIAAEPAQDGERSVTLRHNGSEQIILLGYHMPALTHPDTPALMILNQILADEPSGRLYQSLVEKGHATSIGSITGLNVDPSLFFFSAQLNKREDINATRDQLVDIVQIHSNYPYTSEELERSRTHLLNSFTQDLSKSDAIGLALAEYCAAGDWRLFFKLRDELKAVKLDDVKRVASVYFKPTNSIVGMFIPSEKPDRVVITAAPSVSSLMKNYINYDVNNKSEIIKTDLPSLEKRTLREQIGSTKIAMLPKKSSNDEVEIAINLNFGNPNTAESNSTAASFVAPMLVRGSEGLSRQQLIDRLSVMKAQLSILSSSTKAIIRIKTDRSSLENTLLMLKVILHKPLFIDSTFNEIRKSRIEDLEAHRDDVQSVANILLSRVFMPVDAKQGNPFYVPTTDESISEISSVTLDQVKNYYKEVWNSSHAEIALVGNFNPEVVKPLIFEALEGFTGENKYTPVNSPLTIPKARGIVLNIPDKSSAVYLAATAFSLQDDDSNFPSLLVASQAFGNIRDSRLVEHLRQKEGFSYSVGAAINVSGTDNKGYLGIFAVYNPKMAKEVEEAIREEITKAIKEGFTKEEVEKTENFITQQMDISRDDDGNLAEILIKQLHTNRTFEFDLRLEDRIKLVTPLMAYLAFRKYIDINGLVTVQVGSFSGNDTHGNQQSSTGSKGE